MVLLFDTQILKLLVSVMEKILGDSTKKHPNMVTKGNPSIDLRSTPHPGCQSPPGWHEPFLGSRIPTNRPSFATSKHPGWGVDPNNTQILCCNLQWVPGTQTTSIFEGQPPKTRPKFQPKQGASFRFQVYKPLRNWVDEFIPYYWKSCELRKTLYSTYGPP